MSDKYKTWLLFQKVENNKNHSETFQPSLRKHSGQRQKLKSQKLAKLKQQHSPISETFPFTNMKNEQWKCNSVQNAIRLWERWKKTC